MRQPANAQVLGYLEATTPSAHSDLVEELARALKASDASLETFCPSPSTFAYVVAYDRDYTIVALAEGMQALAFRVPAHRVQEALGDGGRAVSRLGDTWVSFPVFTQELDASRERLARWATIVANR